MSRFFKAKPRRGYEGACQLPADMAFALIYSLCQCSQWQQMNIEVRKPVSITFGDYMLCANAQSRTTALGVLGSNSDGEESAIRVSSQWTANESAAAVLSRIEKAVGADLTDADDEDGRGSSTSGTATSRASATSARSTSSSSPGAASAKSAPENARNRTGNSDDEETRKVAARMCVSLARF